MGRILLTALFCLAVLSGCSETQDDAPAARGDAVSSRGGAAVSTAETAGRLEDWGVTMTVEEADASGAVCVWERCGGSPSGELSTGSWFDVQRLEDGEWTSLPYAVDNVGWTSEAILLPEDGTLEQPAAWEWLYGELPAGEYRLVREVMDFRGTGDYDTKEIAVLFTVE